MGRRLRPPADEMNKSLNPHFTGRLNASAAAKKLQLERAALARFAADSPAAAEPRGSGRDPRGP